MYCHNNVLGTFIELINSVLWYIDWPVCDIVSQVTPFNSRRKWVWCTCVHRVAVAEFNYLAMVA